jgi:histone deacetylase HOS1
MVTSLIKAFHLHKLCQRIEIGNVLAKELQTYHDADFINCLMRRRTHLDETLPDYCELSRIVKSWCLVPTLDEDNSESNNNSDDSDGEIKEDSCEDVKQLEQFGLKYDCFPFPFMSHYVKSTAGSSIYAAKALITAKSNGKQNIAINWYGGRHHCTKRRASGYCYINDVILAIGTLRKAFDKVFYLDLDLHHGDGVELGYKHSRKVYTCSVHRYDIGFFPGTGSVESCRPNQINIPTKRGLCDESMNVILTDIVIPLIEKFQPNVVVLQLGCDGLGTDVHKEWNLTIKGFGDIIKLILEHIKVPVLVLGGGGYNHRETAKCWSYITKTIVQENCEWDLIPEHEHLDEYEEDGYQFWTMNNTKCRNMKDENDEDYIEKLKSHILSV